jgi:hypothetical protein
MLCSDLPPVIFEFYIGAPGGPSLYVRCDRGVVRYERAGGGSFSGKVNEIVPEPEAWAKFWSAVDGFGVWNWIEEYTAAHSCCDVTYWHLRMDNTEGRTISTRGADAYPDHGFSGFLAAVHDLVDLSDNPFRYLR